MNCSKKFQPDKILAYFKAEWKVLLLVTISGLIYNLGLLAGPWFEGKMTGCLVDVLKGRSTFTDMLRLVIGYVVVIAVVQISRYIKRFYVRRFANNVNRNMKEILYGSLVRKSRASLREEGEGTIMTKAILDVDDCVEGMRKFTTEIFDTGVAMAAYIGMLLWYDWRLALLCMIFPPISYITAEKMKTVVQRTGAAYKVQSGILSAATLDRAENAITYRVFGREKQRQEAYEQNLTDYEKSAVKANIWNTAMPPLYRVISMVGVFFILYFGQKNVLGSGWQTWTIASFTTFLACFLKLAVKSSSAAKLFNAVHKAQVSWNRIKPLMTVQQENMPIENNRAAEFVECDTTSAESNKEAENTVCKTASVKNGMETDNPSCKTERVQNDAKTSKSAETLAVNRLTFAYPEGKTILNDISFEAQPGQIIGITGSVACGKSTLGKAFLYEYPYEGEITYQNRELRALSQPERRNLIGYLGHDPELFNDTIEHNILLGDDVSAENYLQAVCMDAEVAQMPDGMQTLVGNGGVRLSGGQAQRLALARTLCHKKPVLILDDPFSALDRSTENEIYEHLREQTKDSIVLLISHRLYLFPQMDQVIWMEHGTTVTGTHEELMHQVPEYAKLYDAQKGE